MDGNRLEPHDPQDIACFEAWGSDIALDGFVRIHRDYLVNPRHVRRVRRRPQGNDWEVTLDPLVNGRLRPARHRAHDLVAGLRAVGYYDW
jgi:hypothetical protein